MLLLSNPVNFNIIKFYSKTLICNPDSTIFQVLLITEEIPVCYDFVQEKVPAKWCSNENEVDGNVQAMIHVGVSSMAKRVTIEERANNTGYSRSDINGKCPDNGR